jgi:hypothetical protein
MEPEGPSPYLPVPATYPYTSPAQSIPYPTSHFLVFQFYIQKFNEYV